MISAATVVYPLAGQSGPAPDEVDLYSLAWQGTQSTPPASNAAAISSPQTFPSIPVSGFTEVEAMLSAPAGSTVVLQTSPDNATWTTVLTSATGQSRQSAAIASSVAYLRANVTAVTGTAAAWSVIAVAVLR